MLHKIAIASRRSKLENLKLKYPGAAIIDVTSRGGEPWCRLSPFHPHGGIPVPNSGGATAWCVEGVWQGLKVFESEGIDLATLENSTGAGLKRTVRRLGPPRGHQYGYGPGGEAHRLLGYIEARRLIYLPTYLWMLEHKAQKEIEELRQLASQKDLVLLDYNTNADWSNPSKPLSHAALVKLYLEGRYPDGAPSLFAQE